MVYSGSKTVAAAGTRERLVSSRTPASWIIFQPTGSGGAVYVGGSAVSSTAGNTMSAGDSIMFPPVSDIMPYDLYEIWVDAANNGDGVKFNYLTR